MRKFLSITVWFPTITLLVACPNANIPNIAKMLPSMCCMAFNELLISVIAVHIMLVILYSQRVDLIFLLPLFSSHAISGRKVRIVVDIDFLLPFFSLHIISGREVSSTLLTTLLRTVVDFVFFLPFFSFHAINGRKVRMVADLIFLLSVFFSHTISRRKMSPPANSMEEEEGKMKKSDDIGSVVGGGGTTLFWPQNLRLSHFHWSLGGRFKGVKINLPLSIQRERNVYWNERISQPVCNTKRQRGLSSSGNPLLLRAFDMFKFLTFRLILTDDSNNKTRITKFWKKILPTSWLMVFIAEILRRLRNFTDSTCLCNFSGELRHTLNISKPSIVFCSSQSYNKLKEATNAEMSVKRIILLDNNENLEDPSLLFISHIIRQQQTELKLEPLSSDDIAVVFYSSGTTGLPKGVMMSHRSLLYVMKTRQYDFFCNISCKLGYSKINFT